MSIPIQCPGCGKRYRFDDRVAGKKARCPCGRTIEVPGPAPDTAPTSQPPDAHQRSEPQEPRAQPAESASAGREDLPSTVSEPPATEGGDTSRKKPTWQTFPPRMAVGILTIVYGSLAALYLFATLVSTTSSGGVGLATMYLIVWLAIAVIMAYGGVLVLNRHPHGHVCAGLACAILFFLPLVNAVYDAFRSLNAIQPGVFLAVVFKSVLLYTIPVLIVVWSVQEETRREAESDELGQP